MASSFEVPILLIAWRRPKAVAQVIRAMRPIKPSRVFVACDGPNPKNLYDYEKVAATRQAIDQEIDWPCNVERLYSDKNLGCKYGVSKAITWFFTHCEEGIILEDDCVPHPDFFTYCASLLRYYRHDTRVWCISGTNFQDGQWRGEGTYYFSHYNHCWGWASWRRCWTYYDPEIRSWPSFRKIVASGGVFENSREALFWTDIWQRLTLENKPDTWDYQWTYTCMSNRGLTALPNKNLIKNIGFGQDATHTIGPQQHALDWDGKLEIVHPEFIIRDKTADEYTFYSIYSPRWRQRLNQLFRHLNLSSLKQKVLLKLSRSKSRPPRAV